MPKQVDPNITFATTNTESAKKVRLTKTLFRQVLEAPVYKFSDKRVESAELEGKIIGFVNYFWKECVQSCYQLEWNGGSPVVGRGEPYWDVPLLATSSLRTISSTCVHVLWVTPNGELRRCVINKDLWDKLPNSSNVTQIFLGGVLFA